jgi:hypothetical protein
MYTYSLDADCVALISFAEKDILQFLFFRSFEY